MRLREWIKRLKYKIQHYYLIKGEKNFVYPLVHRVHLRKGTFVVVDCEMGCDAKRLERIIKGYKRSRIYEKERIPLMIFYRENSKHAYRLIKPFLEKYEEDRLRLWFYESPTSSFGISRMAKCAMAYINANHKYSQLPSINEEIDSSVVKVCMFRRDEHWRWMFPNMVCCDTEEEFYHFFKDLLQTM